MYSTYLAFVKIYQGNDDNHKFTKRKITNPKWEFLYMFSPWSVVNTIQIGQQKSIAIHTPTNFYPIKIT